MNFVKIFWISQGAESLKHLTKPTKGMEDAQHLSVRTLITSSSLLWTIGAH